MRILTRTQYDAICDIVMGQKKIIEKKEAEIKRLKAQVERLSYLLDAEMKADDDYNTQEDMASLQHEVSKIDFPNSSVEKWNGYHGHCIAPAGTFNKIWNDPDTEEDF